MVYTVYTVFIFYPLFMTDAKKTEIVDPLQDTIKKEIARFWIADQAIKEYQEQYWSLEITDLDDKEQFDKVHEARMKMRDIRIDIEKKRKEATEWYRKIKESIDDEAKRITKPIADLEESLKAQEERVEAHKAQLKAEKERKAKEKLQDRLNKLAAVGGTIDVALLERLTDDEFAQDLAKFTKLFEDKKAEEAAAAQKLEEERKEREAAAAKIKKEQDELEEKQKAFQKEQEDARIAKEKAEQEIRDREAAVEAEKKRLEEAERKRLQDIEDEKIRKAQEEADRKQKEAQAIIDAENARKKAEEERIQAEKAEQERLAKIEAERPDRERLINYVDAIMAIPIPEIKSPELARFIPQIQNTLGQMEHIIKMCAIDPEVEELKREEQNYEAEQEKRALSSNLEE